MPVATNTTSTADEGSRVLSGVDEPLRPALRAWIAGGSYVAEPGGVLPSIPDFHKRYAGHWPDFAEYTERLAEDIGLLDDPDEVAHYSDQSWARELAVNRTTADAPGGGVFVYRNF